jgi:hypothetical protein
MGRSCCVETPTLPVKQKREDWGTRTVKIRFKTDFRINFKIAFRSKLKSRITRKRTGRIAHATRLRLLLLG